MSDKDRKRASLQSKLKNLFEKDPEISYNMNVQNGLFRLAMTEDTVTGYLSNKPIQTLKIAELDEVIQESLKDDTEAAAVMILDTIIEAHNKGKISKESKYNGDSISWDDQHENVTQKQLEKGDVLHDRKDKEWDTITENQLDSSSENYEHPTRWHEEEKGLTEKQLANKKNLHADTSPREDKDRDSVTQKQLEGVAEHPASGRRDYEADSTTEIQLEKDFRGGELHSLTEKQLGGGEQKADKTLIRRLASKEDAISFAKKIAKSAAKSISKNHLTVEDAIDALKKSTKGYKSQKRIADFLDKKAQAMDMDAPMVMEDEEVNPEGLAQDVLGDDELTGGYDIDLIMEVIPRLFEKPEIKHLIQEAMEEMNSMEDGLEDEVDDLGMLDMALEDDGMMDDGMGEDAMAMHHAETADESINKEASDDDSDDDSDEKSEDEMCEDCDCCPCECVVEADTDTEEEETIEKEADSDDDGLIAVEGEIAELELGEKYTEQQLVEAGFKKTIKTAQTAANGEEVATFRFDVNKEKGLFRAVYAKKEISTDKLNPKEGLDKRASNRADKLNKLAQMGPAGGGTPEMGGEMGGGGTTMPSGPADPTLGTPPIESFTESEDSEMMSGDEEFDVSPPGTKCPVCGSDDVEVENGSFDCHDCEAQGEMSIEMNVTRWPGTIEDSKGDMEGDMEGDLGEEPMMGEEPAMDLGMPMAASVTTLGRKFYKKASESGKMVFMAGKFCPTCSSDNTEVEIDGSSQCFSCSQKYVTKVASDGKDIKLVTVWRPITEAKECKDCDVEKIASNEEKMLKIASANYQFQAPLNANQFNDCLGKMSRRFGLNAIAMSGACKGKPLAQCTCNKMYSADKNSDALIMRLANRLIEKDPMNECVEDKIREGLDSEASCDACEALKKKAFFEFPEEEEIELIVDTPMSDMEGDDIMVDGLDNDGILEEVAALLHKIEDMMGGDAHDIIDDSDNLLEDNSFDSDDVDGLDNDDDGDHDMDDHDMEDSDDDMEDSDDDMEDMEDMDDMDDMGGDLIDESKTMKMDDMVSDPVEDAMNNLKDAVDSVMNKESMGDDMVEDNAMEDMDDNEESCGGMSMSSTEEGENPALPNEEEEINKLAQNMKSSNIKRYNETDTLSTLTTADTMQINDLLGDRKISDQAKEVTPDRKTSQEETGEIGKVQDGSTMGHEEKFDASEPDVPMGKNESLLGPDEEIPTDKVSIPAGDGAMGHEKETVGDEVMTDHDGRVQQTTAKNQKQTKVANEKVIKDPVALEDSKDLKGQKLQDGSTMGHEEKFDAKDPDVPTGNQVLGPDESKDMDEPKIPAGGGVMGHEKDIVDTEVDTEIKGTVIANVAKKEIQEAEVKAERIKLATKLASLEMMDGEIAEKDYDKEIETLAMSSVPTIKTLLARYVEQRAKKVASKESAVKTASAPAQMGLETPLLSGLSGETKEDTLASQLTSMFKLTKDLDKYEKYND